MSAAERWELVSENDYLARELLSDQKHEYVAGVIYAMAGAKNRHNKVVMNCTGSLFSRLRGKKCEPFNSDTKVRIRQESGTRFYYPDAMVVCSSNSEDDSFQDSPEVIIEVLSDSTRRIDEGEKKDAYLTIPRLGVYLLVEQESPLVIVFRRSVDGIGREVYQGLDITIPLPEIDAELPLSEIYDGIKFSQIGM